MNVSSASGRMALRVVGSLVLLLATACSFASRQAGVANLWRTPGKLDGLEIGSSRIADVLDRLGPPSQMVAIGDRTLLYYLLEVSETDALFLVVYNDSATRIRYDRAIFLFDAEGHLQEMSISEERAPVPPPGAESEES